MDEGNSMWSRKGATLSDKSARQEFGLTQQEIIAAIRVGKLQFRESNMHGNPWYRLLRHEVESLVRDKSGQAHLHKKKLQKELADLNKEKGSAFAKTRFMRLRQEDHTWEADFRALPKPVTQNETHYLGIVVSKEGGSVLAHSQVEGRPSANDLTTLLAQAMRQPLTGRAHRPRRLHVRGHPQWRELFPHLEALGIGVSIHRELPKVKDAYEDHLRQMREARRAKMVRPTGEQAAVEQAFPAIAKWVRSYGHVEIGDQESFGFVVRALDYGGLVFEDDKPDTLAEAMAALEKGLAEYFEREGIE